MAPTFLTIFLAVSIPPKIGFGKKKNAEFALNAGLNSASNLYTRMFITHKTLALATKWEFCHSRYRVPGGCGLYIYIIIQCYICCVSINSIVHVTVNRHFKHIDCW